MSDQSTTGFVFEDPPASKGRSSGASKYATELEPLIDTPSRWIRFRSGIEERSARTLAYRIKKLGTEQGRFDAVARKQPDGTAGVWVQYILNDGIPADTPARSRRRSRTPEQPEDTAVA